MFKKSELPFSEEDRKSALRKIGSDFDGTELELTQAEMQALMYEQAERGLRVGSNIGFIGAGIASILAGVVSMVVDHFRKK